jgi:hypothetical protein
MGKKRPRYRFKKKSPSLSTNTNTTSHVALQLCHYQICPPIQSQSNELWGVGGAEPVLPHHSTPGHPGLTEYSCNSAAQVHSAAQARGGAGRHLRTTPLGSAQPCSTKAVCCIIRYLINIDAPSAQRPGTRQQRPAPSAEVWGWRSTRRGYRAAARYSLHEDAAGNASSRSDYLPLRALRTTRDDLIDLARLA